MEAPLDNGWHLDKKVPIALILAMLVQTATIVWWASAITARVGTLEAKAVRGDAQVADIAALKVQLQALDARTARIEDKVDRLIERSNESR